MPLSRTDLREKRVKWYLITFNILLEYSYFLFTVGISNEYLPVDVFAGVLGGYEGSRRCVRLTASLPFAKNA